jgi:hypothetical protein
VLPPEKPFSRDEVFKRTFAVIKAQKALNLDLCDTNCESLANAIVFGAPVTTQGKRVTGVTRVIANMEDKIGRQKLVEGSSTAKELEKWLASDEAKKMWKLDAADTPQEPSLKGLTEIQAMSAIKQYLMKFTFRETPQVYTEYRKAMLPEME